MYVGCVNSHSLSKVLANKGYLGDHPGKGLDLVEVSYPCPRWVSSSCAVTYTNGRGRKGLIIGLCPACSGEGDGRVKEEINDVESEDYGVPDNDHEEEERRRFKRTRKKLEEKKARRDQMIAKMCREKTNIKKEDSAVVKKEDKDKGWISCSSLYDN